MKAVARPTLAVLTWSLVVLIPAQFYLAGVGVFGASSFAPHIIMGTIITVVILGMFAVAAFGGLGRSLVYRTGLIALLMLIQGSLPHLDDSAPYIAALHPVNGLILAALVAMLAKDVKGDLPVRRPRGERVSASGHVPEVTASPSRAAAR